jgi:hypothetical protein
MRFRIQSYCFEIQGVRGLRDFIPVVRQNDIAGEKFKNHQHPDRRSPV